MTSVHSSSHPAFPILLPLANIHHGHCRTYLTRYWQRLDRNKLTLRDANVNEDDEELLTVTTQNLVSVVTFFGTECRLSGNCTCANLYTLIHNKLIKILKSRAICDLFKASLAQNMLHSQIIHPVAMVFELCVAISWPYLAPL